MVFEHEQSVRIWHRSGQYDKKSRILLTDTGASDNFISRSIVEELELETTPIIPTTIAFAGQNFIVSERVQPKWQFHKGSWRHQEFSFLVISDIPDDRDMLLGNIARKELKIELRISGPLVALEDYGGLSWPSSRMSSLFVNVGFGTGQSTLTRQQQQRERQLRDNTASQSKIRRDLEARHAKMVQKRAAANAATRENPSNPTPQKVATGSGSNQGK